MLDRDGLTDLYRRLRDQPVLSVYLDADEHDPAARGAWRRRLEHELSGIRGRLESGGEEAEQARFEDAAKHLETALRPHDAFLPGLGFVGFSTPEGLAHEGGVRVPMPDVIHWGRGMRVSPYLRALKQTRPVVAVLLDSQRARLCRYLAGELREPLDFRADTYLGDLSDVNMAKRATRSTGVRGETETDAAQTLLDVGRERMLKEVVAELVKRAGSDGFVVLGGVTEVISAAEPLLPKSFEGRVAARPSLYLEIAESDLRSVVEEAASELTRARQNGLLASVLDAAGAGGLGCVGEEATAKALADGQVDTLLLTRTFIREHPTRADAHLGEALAHAGSAEELSGEPGARLDEEGGGVAARLRYRP